ncbi:hypothetical protein WKW79_28955 [Variovorax robiniae]|uniref:Uncharacterized protein n=1 Tax=Variovorax robiniae TaxID=1836199 RepID=A0ABU8XHZ8_9BURK
MLSETEIEHVGLGLARAILFGDYDGTDEDEERFDHAPPSASPIAGAIVSRPAVNAARLKEAARLVAGLTVKSSVRAKLVYHLMREETDSAIASYLQRERIPAAYHALIRLVDCIEILVRGIFYKVAALPRKVALDAEVARLCASLKANEEKLIVYDRVGVLQRFVHEKLRLHGDDGIVERVRVEPMRCLLSVARLHLNLVDLEARDPGYAIYLNEVSSARASLEYLSPSPPPLAVVGKHVYTRWRVRHLRPLSYFYRRRGRGRLSVLLTLDIELAFDAYVEAACRGFALNRDAPARSAG